MSITIDDGDCVESDNDLMNRVRAGDIDVLGMLFERHKKKLYSFFMLSTGRREVSEDLVQDVFIRILRYRHTYGEDSDFTAWMYGIARNARVDHYRNRNNRIHTLPIEDSPEPPSDCPAPDAEYERKIETETLRLSLMKLDRDTREMIVLSRYNNLKYKEIGDMFGITEGAVKVRMHRALKELAAIYHELENGKREIS